MPYHVLGASSTCSHLFTYGSCLQSNTPRGHQPPAHRPVLRPAGPLWALGFLEALCGLSSHSIFTWPRLALQPRLPFRCIVADNEWAGVGRHPQSLPQLSLLLLARSELSPDGMKNLDQAGVSGLFVCPSTGETYWGYKCQR